MKAFTSAGLLTFLVWGCGDTGPTQPLEPAEVLVTAPVSELVVGDTTMASAVIHDQNGDRMSDVSVSWASSDSEVATVSSSGVITGLVEGPVRITASASTVEGSVDLDIVPPPAEPESVVLTAPVDELEVGDTVTVTAEVRDQYGEVMGDVVVEWSSGEASRATVSGDGLVTALAEGPVVITASVGSATGSLDLTITPVAVASVEIEESAMVLRVSDARQLHVVLLDGERNRLEGREVVWASSDPARVAVSEDGLVTAVAEGAASVSARSEGEEGSVAITVEPADVSSYMTALAELQDSVDVATASSGMWWAYTVDVGGDGYPDVVIQHAEDQGGVLTKHPLLLFRNVENTRFEKVETGIPAWGRVVVAADFTGDGLEDLFFADHGEESTQETSERTLGTNQLLVQDGGGGFVETTATALPDTLAYSHGACAGDLTGDGALDIVVNMLQTEQVLINNGDGTFTERADYITPDLDTPGDAPDHVDHPIDMQPWACAAGDFRNTGLADVLMSNDGYQVPADYGDGYPNPYQAVGPFGNVLPQSAKLLFNDHGTALEYRHPESLIVSPWDESGTAAVGLNTLPHDFNHDGCLDFAVYSTDYVNAHKAEVYLGDCTGAFGEPQVFDLPSIDYLWEDIVLADVDRDGWMDLIFSNNMADDWQWGGGNRSDMHVVLENEGGVFTLREGQPSDAAYVPTGVAVSWDLGSSE